VNELVKWKQFDLTALAGPAGEVAIDDPRRELRIGAIIAGFFFVIFLGWAAFAPMDAAAYAPGHLQVSGQRQRFMFAKARRSRPVRSSSN
jgi:hypothetical protein